MSLRRIKHMFLRLSPEEKIIGSGAICILIGSFMPWYSMIMSFDKRNVTENGFGGDLGVIGFVIFLMAILAVLVLIGEYLHIRLPQLGYSKEQVLFFLMGEDAFLVLLTIGVYTKRSLQFTDAGLRFGIYLALIGAFAGAFATFSQMQKLKRKEIEEFFEHEEEKEIEKYEKKETIKTEPDPQLYSEENFETEPMEEEIYKNETEELSIESEKPLSPLENQGNYFMREANLSGGIKHTDTENHEENRKEEKSGLSMDFYDD